VIKAGCEKTAIELNQKNSGTLVFTGPDENEILKKILGTRVEPEKHALT
jgi:hypothetical protein